MNNTTDHFNITKNHVCSEMNSESSISQTLKVFAIISVSVFGIGGNVFIIVLAVKYLVTRSLHHLIINMAVADTFLVLTTLSLELPRLFHPEIWADIKEVSGHILCKAQYFIINSSMWVTFVSLVIISIQRFRATRPMAQISRPYTLKQRISVMLCCLVVSLGLAAEQLLYRSILQDNNRSSCEYAKSMLNFWDIFMLAFVFSGYFTIFTLSFITLRRLSTGNAIQASLSEAQRKARAKKMAGAIKMGLCSLLLYSCCYVSYDIVIIFRGFSALNSKCLNWKTLEFVLALLPLLNALLSPVIYLIFMSDFREAAKKLVFRFVQWNVVRRGLKHGSGSQDTKRAATVLAPVAREENENAKENK